jgi:hypothetical protein
MYHGPFNREGGVALVKNEVLLFVSWLPPVQIKNSVTDGETSFPLYYQILSQLGSRPIIERNLCI